jgi:hypothetical protein
MAPQLTDPEAGFIFGCRAMDSTVSLDKIANALHAWRKEKLRPQTGSGTDAVRPDKSSVHRVLSGETHEEVGKDMTKKAEKRGHPSDMTDGLRNKVPRLLQGLETKNPYQNVVARMVTEEIATRVPDGSRPPKVGAVKRALNESGRNFLPNPKKLKLTQEKADIRLEFSEQWEKKPVSFWQTKVLAADEGSMKYYTSANARAKGRSMRKTHAWIGLQSLNTLCRVVSLMKIVLICEDS